MLFRSPNAMSSVIESIYRYIIQNKSYGKLLDESLDDSIFDILGKQSPRAIKLAIEEAAFKAIRHQRTSISISDLPYLGKEKKHVGFI